MPTQERIRILDADGISSRKIAARLGVSRNTVAKYVTQQDFSPSPTTRQPASLVDAYAHTGEAWLLEGLGRPRKQRHTGTRVYEGLVAARGGTGPASPVPRRLNRGRDRRPSAA